MLVWSEHSRHTGEVVYACSWHLQTPDSPTPAHLCPSRHPSLRTNAPLHPFSLTLSSTGSKAELATKVAALEAQAQQSAAELTQAKSQAARFEAEAASAKSDLTAAVERLEARCVVIVVGYRGYYFAGVADVSSCTV